MWHQLLLLVVSVATQPSSSCAFEKQSAAEALGKVVNMMENLLGEYDNQDNQLERIHGKLSYLKYGYNSLNHKISTVECSMSERLGVTSSAEMWLETLKTDTETELHEIETCLDEAQEQLYFLTDFLHPCGEGTWRRVVKHIYSSPACDGCPGGDDCPGGWVQFIDPGSGRRFCGGASAGGTMPTCDEATFETNGEYSRVCGRVIGYGEAFGEGFANFGKFPINGAYVDGVSVTYNDMTGARQHVWTFAVGFTSVLDLDIEIIEDAVCPCVDNATSITPDFVGVDYFCESGFDEDSQFQNVTIHNLDDPLWDGRQCPDNSQCCDPNMFNNGEPPFFVKDINDNHTPTSLEVRICNQIRDEPGNLLVEEIEFYVE